MLSLSTALLIRLATARECGGELMDAQSFEIDLNQAKDCHAVLFDELSLGNTGATKVAAALDSMSMDILSLHGNGIADVLEQFADGRFGDRFTQRGNFDFGGHNLAFPSYLQSLRTLGAVPFSPSAMLTRASCCTWWRLA